MRVGVSVLFLVVAFAGCVTPWPGQGDCTFAGAPCKAEPFGWSVQDVHVAGSVELRVATGPEVVLRNVTVSDANDVRLHVLCSCTVRGEGFRVEGSGPSAQVWLLSDRQDPARGVALDGLDATGLSRIDVSDLAGRVTISNTTTACRPGGIAFQLSANEKTEAFHFDRVTTDQCAEISFSQRGDGPRTAIIVSGSRLAGPGPDGDRADAIVGTAGSTYHVTLVDSTIAHTRYAVDVRAGDSLTMRNSTISDSDTAISMSGDAHAVLDGVTLQANLFAIRGWDGARLEANGSRFLDNRAGVLDDCTAAVSGDLTGWIHASTFSGNGLSVSVGGMDATGNYWGSPSGPVPVPVISCPSPSMPAEAVTPTVAYVPFLTAPP